MTRLSIRPGILTYTGIQAFFTFVQGLLVWQIKNDFKEKNHVSTKSKIVALIISLSLFTGNVFLTISSFYLLKSKRSTAYAFATYMVITDVVVILVSSVNLFKPYVSNTFLPSMYGLVIILILHIAFLFLMDQLKRLRNGTRLLS